MLVLEKQAVLGRLRHAQNKWQNQDPPSKFYCFLVKCSFHYCKFSNLFNLSTFYNKYFGLLPFYYSEIKPVDNFIR